jgi:nicotinate-nucleotide adenylyltransferase
MATVALFGGSFNPPHVAHHMLAVYALATCDLDEVWFVPTFRHAFGKGLASYEDRVAMCELLTAEIGSRAQVSRAEQTLAAAPGFVVSRTLDLIEHLQACHPAHRFRLLIGADILLETDKWYRWDEVARQAPPIVVGRAEVVAPPQATVSEYSMPGISSTEVRRRLQAQEPVNWLVPRGVLGYIAAKGLYR